jgi:hypothetical protein
MSQDFIPDSEETFSAPAFHPAHTPHNPEREPVQIIVIGSKEGITNIIQSLYAHRFAQISEWSPLLSASIPGKLMRTMIRYIPK